MANYRFFRFASKKSLDIRAVYSTFHRQAIDVNESANFSLGFNIIWKYYGRTNQCIVDLIMRFNGVAWVEEKMFSGCCGLEYHEWCQGYDIYEAAAFC